EQHLGEVAADGAMSLVEALGPPDRYAAELRASAGLPGPPATPAASPTAAEGPASPAPRPGPPVAWRHGIGAAVAVASAAVAVVTFAATEAADAATAAWIAVVTVATLALAHLARRTSPAPWRDAAAAVVVAAGVATALVVGTATADTHPRSRRD